LTEGPIPTWCEISLVLRDRRHYLLCPLRDGLDLPAGLAAPGETFLDTALRLGLEVAGVEPQLEGLLRLAHGPVSAQRPGQLLQLCFLARPVGRLDLGAPTLLGAHWFALPELVAVRLARPGLLALLEDVDGGRPFAPISLLEDAR
jgi:ADP-ribose pyrophosphatase YjhB (NUDIX family)